VSDQPAKPTPPSNIPINVFRVGPFGSYIHIFTQNKELQEMLAAELVKFGHDTSNPGKIELFPVGTACDDDLHLYIFRYAKWAVAEIERHNAVQDETTGATAKRPWWKQLFNID